MLFILVIASLLGSCSNGEFERYEFVSVHMGTEFQLVFYASDSITAERASNAVFNRIEELNTIMSDYLEESEINRLANTAGSGNFVEVSSPLFEVVKRSLEISKETNGRFDITIGPYSRIWRGINREQNPQLPSPQELREASKKVGFQLISIDQESRQIRLNQEGMLLDLGGIAKGYAADEGLGVLDQFGIRSAFVNGGGDIAVGDPPPGLQGWNIAIPLLNVDEPEFMELSLSSQAITTSGQLYQNIEIDGVEYSHIIDPFTGIGITEKVQVSVISEYGIDADAYASALSVMGIDQATQFVRDQEEIEAFIQYVSEEGIESWQSDGFNEYVK
jgi:FAD:protein FMN transferase